MREFDIEGLRQAEFQAEIFEASATKADCSSLIFLRRYGKSKLALSFDRGTADYSLTVEDALREIEEEFGHSSYGKDKYPASVLHWLGYQYRYIAYTRQCETRFLFRLFPPKKMASTYLAFHTQSQEWVVASWLEIVEKDEKIFSPFERAKAYYRKVYGL